MVEGHRAELTERIRQSSDITDVVSAYVSLKRAGRSLRGLCPFHNEKTPSFHVNPERQTFKCFGCGAGGDVYKFIQLRESVDFLDARTILANRANIRLDEPRKSGPAQGDIAKPDLERVNRWAELWFRRALAGPSGQKARDYVSSRGISSESVERFSLGLATDSWDALTAAATKESIPQPLLMAAGLIKQSDDGRFYDAFRNRLMFPLRDALGRVIAFGGRALGDEPAKYLNSPQSALFDKSRCMYGLDLAKDAFRASRRAIVVEGYVDCLMAHQHGFSDTVATLGTALTAEHVQLLGRYVDKVDLLFDSDTAGQRAAEQTLPLFMLSQLDVRLAHVPEGKDPADLLQIKGRPALEDALTSAIPALEFKWRQVQRRYQSDAAGPEQRRAVEEFLGLVAQSSGFGSCDPIQRGLILNRVGKLLGLSAEEVNRQLRIVARKVANPSPATAFAPEARAPVVADAAAAAMRELLEVLLNAPELYPVCQGDFTPEFCQDVDLAAIALAFADLAGRGTSFDLPALISRFESIRTANRITELQSSGERRGNYRQTVDLAVARLRTLREQNRISAALARWREDAPEHPQSQTPEPSALPRDGPVIERPCDPNAATEAVRQMTHFAARRHRAAPLTVGAVPGESQGAG